MKRASTTGEKGRSDAPVLASMSLSTLSADCLLETLYHIDAEDVLKLALFVGDKLLMAKIPLREICQLHFGRIRRFQTFPKQVFIDFPKIVSVSICLPSGQTNTPLIMGNLPLTPAEPIPSLTSLSLWFAQATCMLTPAAASISNIFPNLRSLDINSSVANHALDLKRLPPLLTRLSVVDIVGCHLDQEVVDALPKTLQYINLPRCTWGTEEGVPSLRAFSALTYLNLSTFDARFLDGLSGSLETINTSIVSSDQPTFVIKTSQLPRALTSFDLCREYDMHSEICCYLDVDAPFPPNLQSVLISGFELRDEVPDNIREPVWRDLPPSIKIFSVPCANNIVFDQDTWDMLPPALEYVEYDHLISDDDADMGFSLFDDDDTPASPPKKKTDLELRQQSAWVAKLPPQMKRLSLYHEFVRVLDFATLPRGLRSLHLYQGISAAQARALPATLEELYLPMAPIDEEIMKCLPAALRFLACHIGPSSQAVLHCLPPHLLALELIFEPLTSSNAACLSSPSWSAAGPMVLSALPSSLECLSLYVNSECPLPSWLENLPPLPSLTNLGLRTKWGPAFYNFPEAKQLGPVLEPTAYNEAAFLRVLPKSLKQLQLIPTSGWVRDKECLKHLPPALEELELHCAPCPMDFTDEHFSGLPKTLNKFVSSVTTRHLTTKFYDVIPPGMTTVQISAEHIGIQEHQLAHNRYMENPIWQGIDGARPLPSAYADFDMM